MSRNTRIGEYVIDGNGVAHKEVTAPALGSPGACYNWVRGHMRYAPIPDGGHAANIQYALNYGRGSCYHYAALLQHTMSQSGMATTYILGRNPQGGRHDWLQYGNHVLDATNGYFMITVDEMRAKGFTW